MREIRDGVLYFDGCNTVDLAKKYGTPLYLMSESDIVNRFNELKECFLNKYENTRVAYASKAFSTMAMYAICKREGMCLDVVSGGEIYTAKKVDFPAEHIEFNGNNKSRAELELAIEYGVGRIIVDGLQELALIEDICREMGKTTKILYRVTPGVQSDSHDYIVTGKKDSKFGIPLDGPIINKAIEDAIVSKYVDFLGFHYHVGSQLFDNGSHLEALDHILDLVKDTKDEFGYDVKELNLGGGFGVTYTSEERKSFAYFLDPMMDKIENFFAQMKVARPEIVIEPGRSIVAEAGMSLYTVGSIKNIPGVRKYVSVDGGMTDNIRPALYEAVYDGVIANKASEEVAEVVRIAGKCCESGDILIRDINVATPEGGDIFAIFSTGAYGYSMASNYNKNPIPAVVLLKDGSDRLIVKRQSYEDMISNEVLPEDLA